MDKKITISDIAKEVGVSKTTVSRYLNGSYEFMSEETKKKIEHVIKLYDYVPNGIARTLKSKKSRLIGVVANSLQYQVGAQTVTEINNVCVRNGYGIVVCCSNNNPEEETQAIQLCLNQQVEGLIIIPVSESPERYLALCEKGIPVVLCTRRVKDWPYGSVFVKHEDLIRRMLWHLKAQGFEKVRFLLDSDGFHKRWMGSVFADYAQELFGMGREESTVLVGREKDNVEAALKHFLNEYPEQNKAVLAVNTHTLFLTLKVLEENKIKIPNELGVCGYDAIGWSELVAPGITAIHQPMDQMGVEAGKKMLNCLKEGGMSQGQLVLDGELFFRNSTQLVKK